MIIDNRAVKLILANANSKTPARIERVALHLSQFDFSIEHRPSHLNIADFYSRHPDGHSSSAFFKELKTEKYINIITQNAISMALTRAEVKLESNRGKLSLEALTRVKR